MEWKYFDIEPSEVAKAAEYTWSVSDWMGVADYVNGECYWYNSKTQERKPMVLGPKAEETNS